ncbi:hypothetical protein [Cryobacterium ruanii]|uniref:hypothetical protein n=1 Tax=Cryobacterium ruanii TaxID=1259197 RepID=UPI00141B9CC7|nr:hypothetical protein [Cryobacterium ruanii]
MSVRVSLLSGPAGLVLAELGLVPVLVTVDNEPDLVHQARQRNAALDHRCHTVQSRA